jgi:hypothetical protein
MGRPDLRFSTDQGLSIRPSLILGDTYQMGFSYFYATNPSYSRQLGGPFISLGFNNHFFLLAELDFQYKNLNSGSATLGFANYERLDYELRQGFHVYFLEQMSRLDFKNPSNFRLSYGLGIQFFPRPHFELNAEYQRVTNYSSDNLSNYFTLMGHFYL